MSDRSITDRVISYIEENLDGELTLQEIAEALSYSRFYVARTFKETMGVSVGRYIRGRRLTEAAGKLAESKQPIARIALEAGYQSQQAFTKAFGCEFGCTPLEYRRKGAYVTGQRRTEQRGFHKPQMRAFSRPGGEMAA